MAGIVRASKREMIEMTKLPEDVMASAETVFRSLDTPEQGPYLQYEEPDIEKIANAIMAERNKCLSVLEGMDPYSYVHEAESKLLEVVKAMANFDGRNNNSHLKKMAKDALEMSGNRAKEKK